MTTLDTSYGRRRAQSGFTLLELMAVIAIIATLAALTLVGFKSAQTTASRNRTAAFHRAIQSGLEQYFNDNGEYPTPKDSTNEGNFQGKSYKTGGARMLYQALSGDGSDAIMLSSAGTASDGKVSGDVEIANVKLTEMPREMRVESDNGWVLVDGFNHPFQYTKGPDRSRTGEAQGSKTTMNATYDLWSYAESDQTTQTDLSAKQDPKISAKWIKNW